ncbi:unnamed protein product [Thelazia callipaeda]|uniref:Coiled-coil domain-containing protein 39 n=1 Tax=Thelazia callipaeda TaxID=103827 RepID=A0A0N5CQR7_THECL|nr:unnamed protein product [Thelazia callipaeda]
MAANHMEQQEIIDAIIVERKAITFERDILKHKVENLEQKCRESTFCKVENENVKEMQMKLNEKENQLHQITFDMNEKEEEITNLHAVIKDLRDEINEKNCIIDDLNRITSEKEWSLGEHRQWLADANRKVGHMKCELNSIREQENSTNEQLIRLKNEIEEKNAKISELNDKCAKMVVQIAAFEQKKETIPNEDKVLELSALREKLCNAEEYVKFQAEQLEYLRQVSHN